MFASLYVINNRKIFKTMQLLKLNALNLLLMINKIHERYMIVENLNDRKFCCLKIIIVEDCDDRR